MSGPRDDVAATPAPAPDAVEWRFNPWRERPRQAAFALVAALAMAAILVALGEHPILTAVMALAVGAALSPVFLPARCRLDDRGAARAGPWGWERRSWAEVRRGMLRPGGVLVSPFARPTWRDPYRALVLPMPRANAPLRAAVAAVLEFHGF